MEDGMFRPPSEEMSQNRSQRVQRRQWALLCRPGFRGGMVSPIHCGVVGPCRGRLAIPLLVESAHGFAVAMAMPSGFCQGTTMQSLSLWSLMMKDGASDISQRQVSLELSLTA